MPHNEYKTHMPKKKRTRIKKDTDLIFFVEKTMEFLKNQKSSDDFYKKMKAVVS